MVGNINTKITMKAFIFSILLLLIFPFTHFAQSCDNLNFVFKKVNSFTSSNKLVSDSTDQMEIISESKYLSMGLIKFYQLYISSQDKPTCIFSLSCSHFAMEAIKYRGVLIGILLAADRLTRCNDIARIYYKIDLKTKKAIDPVPYYEF